TVGQRAGEGLAAVIAASGIEPLDSAGDIGEGSTSGRGGVELSLVTDDEMLIRADGCRRRQHNEVELAVAIAERVVGALAERSLARDRSAVSSKDLSAYDRWRLNAHAAAGSLALRELRQQVAERHIPGVAAAGVLDVETESAWLTYSHRRRA